MTTANPIHTLRQQIAVLGDITRIRTQLLDILFESINARKDAWGVWEKAHFSNAVTALTLNIYAFKQPSYAWLEICLMDLENAMTPAHLRDSNYSLPDGSVQNAKHEQLIDALECLRRELQAGIRSSRSAT